MSDSRAQIESLGGTLHCTQPKCGSANNGRVVRLKMDWSPNMTIGQLITMVTLPVRQWLG